VENKKVVKSSNEDTVPLSQYKEKEDEESSEESSDEYNIGSFG
jgi:hypothetical protein